MPDAIALIDDLFFQAKVRETAKRTGVTIETATTGEQLLKAAEASPDALILVDLNARQGALDAVPCPDSILHVNPQPAVASLTANRSSFFPFLSGKNTASAYG